ncbi:MAG: transglutaminase family protein, partial [Pseudomonadota bacterium]
ASAASQSLNQICLTPRNTPFQQCLQSTIDITPRPDSIDYRLDQYSNTIAAFNLTVEHTQCDIVVTSLIETTGSQANLPAGDSVTDNQRALHESDLPEALMAIDCLLPSPLVPLDNSVDTIIHELPVKDTPVVLYAEQLMQHIYTTFRYESGFSTLVTPLTEIIAARKGVCQDFAHLAVAVCRRQGVPARYVSGYLETRPPPGEKKLQGADASHAWFSVYCATTGWWDFDPTNNKQPDHQYVTTAWGRDYDDVVPIKGVVYGGGSHTLTVEVDVNRTEVTPSLVRE